MIERETLITLGVFAIVSFWLYRRGRRLLGRQQYRGRRLMIRCGFLGAVAMILVPVLTATRGPWPAAWLLAGGGMGLVGLLLTRFETDEDDLYFTPNAYLGMTLLIVIAGRLTYRAASVRSWLEEPEMLSLAQAPTAIRPVASELLLCLIGYFLIYSLSVFVRGRSMLDERG